MLKRLLTAVFVLGLILALNGTAFSTGTVPPEVSGKNVTLVSPMHVGTPSSVKLTKNFTSSMGRIRPAVVDNSPAGPRPVVNDADTVECYLQDNSVGNTGAYRIDMYGASGPFYDEDMSAPFKVNNYPKYVAIIDKVYGLIRFGSHNGGGGLPVRVRIWNDDGAGFPGTLAGSATFTLPSRISAATWVTFTLPTPVTVTGPKYHVSLGNDPSAGAGDSLSLRIGAPAKGGSYYLYGGTWYTMIDALGVPADQDTWIATHQCEVYTKCAWISPFSGYVWLWPTPDNGWPSGHTNDGWAQRFVAAGPETIQTIRVQHYDFGPAYYGPGATNGIKVMVMGDDGAGNPDGIPKWQTTISGVANLFPTGGVDGNGWESIYVPCGYVINGPFHIAFQTTSSNPADGMITFATSREDGSAYNTDGSGGSVDFLPPGSAWQNTGLNADFMEPTYGGGTEVGVLIRYYQCLDEFYTCATKPTYQVGQTAWLYMDQGQYGTRSGVAQLIKADPVNRVEKIRLQVGDEYSVDGWTPDVPNSMKVSVWSASGDNMGTELWSTILTNDQITWYPGWTEVVIPGGVQALTGFFVAMEPIFTLDGDQEWMYMARERSSDNPSVTLVNGGMWVKLLSDGLWYNNKDITGNTNNAIFEADYCSIPPDEWKCTAGPDNFVTSSYDYARDGHTCVSLSDAYCDLNYKWMYEEPAGSLGSVGNGGGACYNTAPVIYDNYVVCAFNSKFNIIDLATGTLVKTLDGAAAPYFVNVNSVRGNPTIATVDVAGTPTPILFYGGGTTYGQVTAVKLVPPFDPLWSINSFTSVGLGYPGAIGNTAQSAFVKANIGGTDYLFFSTGNGSVYAANPATGAKIWGPLTLNSYNTFRNLAFDGTTLYLAGTEGGTSVNGDVYAVNAAAGTIKWQLSSAPGGGLKGGTLQAGSVGEIFPDQIAFAAASDGNQVWATSAWLEPTAPSEGLIYKIKASNGALFSTPQPTQHFYQGQGTVVGANLMVDAKRVIVPGGNAWTSVPMGGTLLSYNRFTGTIDWKTTGGGPIGSNGTYLGNGFMTLETNAPDLIFAGDSKGYLSCFNGDTGKEIFHRRLDNLHLAFSSAWAGGAVSKEGVVVFATRIGQLFALEKGVNRPRLELVKTTGKYNVPYGSPASVLVTFSKMFTNTGCGVLTGTATFSATSNGSVAGVAAMNDNNTVVGRTESIANQLAHNSTELMKNAQLALVNEDLTDSYDSKSLMNRAAMSNPIFLNPPFTQSFTLNPGDSGNLNFDVNGPMVNRGPNNVYVQFQSNDPDYFLDDHAEQPQIVITFMGGCLIDTTALNFGPASANLRWVTNSGRLGTGDWTPHAFKFGTNVADFYQGTYVMGVSTERLAMNTQDWTSGGGEDNSWNSMQGDPNLCNNDCKPALLLNVPLGKVSTDGVTYTDLFGRVVCKSFIDSVQNFGPPYYASWSWGYSSSPRFGAPFDQTMSMGLQVHSRTFAAKDVPAPFDQLNNVTVDHMKIFQRYGLALAGWKFGSIIDYDIGGDTAGIDQSISTVWSFTPGAASGNAMGMIKLPFGGAYAPVKNVKALDADQAQFKTTCRGNCYWDSAYTYMSQAAPISHVVSSAPQDQEMHATLAEHDFAAGSDTYEFAIAHFWLPNVTNPANSGNYAGLANLVNKWVGFGRGDVNNDGAINLADILYLAAFVNGPAGTPGPIPFAHLGDVDANNVTDAADVQYLVNYYFYYGAAPLGQFIQY